MKTKQAEENLYLRPGPDSSLSWGPLIEGRLLRRYKRFLADVEMADGTMVTVHTPNTGRMTGCSEPGRPVWVSYHDRPNRKYAHTWEMIDMPGALVGVNTGVPNKLVALAANQGFFPKLPFPSVVRAEVPLGRSRLDLQISDGRGPEIFIEIKNCTLAENGVAYFPDAVTARGTKHLEELEKWAKQGGRAIIMVVVQRADADIFSPADHIDPEWGSSLRRALTAGVELWAYRAELSLEKIKIGEPLPLKLD